MRLAGLILLATGLASCAAPVSHDPPGVAHIARDVVLTLPKPPGYPEKRELHQIVTAKYGPRTMTFESLAELSPERVHVTIITPNGPRLAAIDWTAAGITSERTPAIPASLRSENMLADLMLVFWPKAAIEQAIPGASVVETADGRTVSAGGKTIAEVSGGTTRTLTNRAFGYTITMATVDE